METLINIYQSLPWILQWFANFMFSIVFLRGIVANELLKEIRKIWAWYKSERATAIRRHYLNRAKGKGHENEDVLACNQGLCQVF